MFPTEPSDEELYRRRFSAESLQTQQAAWEELERRHRGNLLAYCYRITESAVAAEDCVADAFIAVLGRRQAIRTSFRAYLWATARNLARRPPRSDCRLTLPPEDCADPVSNLISREERRALEQSLARLDSDEREFLLLHVCDGLTYEEAAQVVGWNAVVSTCKYRFDKSLERLRAFLKNSRFPSKNPCRVPSDVWW